MQRIPVESSNIASVGFDADRSTLEVQFTSGGTYHYLNVPLRVFGELLAAQSKGRYFAEHIKPLYTVVKVDPDDEVIEPALLQAGIYRHFKGRLYCVYGVARHSETGEDLVVYRPLYGDRALTVRPLAMFTEQVSRDGYEGPRFRFESVAEEPAHE